MMDIGAVEQRADGRNQHDVVGANQFPQFQASVYDETRRHINVVNGLAGLAATRGSFYCRKSEHGPEKWVPVFRKDDAQTSR
jgi:hypothetical protein